MLATTVHGLSYTNINLHEAHTKNPKMQDMFCLAIATFIYFSIQNLNYSSTLEMRSGKFILYLSKFSRFFLFV